MVILCSCGNEEQKETEKKKNRTVTSDFSDEPATADIDYTNPIKVVEAMFEAAQTHNLEKLNNLCDPMGQNDENSMRICELRDDEVDKFIAYFAKGSVKDGIKIKKDTAWVPIAFGKEGNKEDVIVLIKRDSSWFILEF